MGLGFNCTFISGIEWKKVYSITRPADLGKGGFFADHTEAGNKNADNETADLFSILYQLEQYRTCTGEFHFKLCYPGLAENYSFPCNEWTQFSNPTNDDVIKDFKPINITFQSKNKDFKGLSLSFNGKEESLIEDHPFGSKQSFSIGTLKGTDGKIPGPGYHLVEEVKLFVNPGKKTNCYIYPINAQCFVLDKILPIIIGNTNTKGATILDECQNEGWNAPEGATGDDAEMVIDMGCPIKLQDISLINGIGDFRTKQFSVFASINTVGPWKILYSGELGEVINEVKL